MTAPSGPVCTSCGVFAGIDHVSPGPSSRGLVADPELAGPGDQDPELLVLVAVLRDDAAGIELDEPEGEPLAVHDAARDSIPDLLRLNLARLFEGAQGAIVPRSATLL